MGTAYKIVIFTFLVGGLIFARSGKNNIKIENKKVKSEHHWVKDHSENKDDKINGKRSHKRRRRVRKPVKGLR